MLAGISELRLLVLVHTSLEFSNLASQKLFGFRSTGLGSILIVSYKDFCQRVCDSLRELGVAVPKLDVNQVRAYLRLNRLPCDDCVFVWLELCQLLRCQWLVSELSLTNDVDFSISWCGSR